MKPSYQPEPLEARIAPANVLHFTDVDGDKVTITTTHGNLDGKASFVGGGTDGQLAELNVTGKGFNGADITISAVKSGGGDGRVNVGYIDGGTNDFGNITIEGDLGKIVCGNGKSGNIAVENLKVTSIGHYGVTTQGGSGDLTSVFYGGVDRLLIKGGSQGCRRLYPRRGKSIGDQRFHHRWSERG